MVIQNSDITLGLVVEHQSDRGIFSVTEIDPSERLVLSPITGEDTRVIAKDLLRRSYRQLNEDGFKSKGFRDPAILTSWVNTAPLRLIFAILVDAGTTQIKERDFRSKIEKLLPAGLSWKSWWDRVYPLAVNERPSFRIRAKSWSLAPNHKPPSDIPLPERLLNEEVKTKRPDSGQLNDELKKGQFNRTLSETTLAVLQGSLMYKDLSDVDRETITRRIARDGLWWWFDKETSIQQIARYDRPFSTLLELITSPDGQPEQYRLLPRFIKEFRGKSSTSKLKKLVDSMDLSKWDGNRDTLNDVSSSLLQLALQITGDDGYEDANRRLVTELIASFVSEGIIGIQDIKDLFGRASSELDSSHESYRRFLRTLLKNLDHSIRVEAIVSFASVATARLAIGEYLTSDGKGPSNILLLKECLIKASSGQNHESLDALIELGDMVCEHVDESQNRALIEMWMICLGRPTLLTEMQRRHLAARVKAYTQSFLDNGGDDESQPNQLFEMFGIEFLSRLKQYEQKANRVARQLEQAKSEQQTRIEDLEQALESEKQLAERLRSLPKSKDQTTEFFDRVKILQPYVDLLQRMIRREFTTSNGTPEFSYTVTRMLELLAIAGITQTQIVGEITDYNANLHECFDDLPESDQQVRVIAPGFNATGPDGQLTTLHKVYVESV